jgi:hypothetical protein
MFALEIVIALLDLETPAKPKKPYCQLEQQNCLRGEASADDFHQV